MSAAGASNRPRTGTLRGAADCALDTYLYLVVEAIEEVDGPLLPAEGKG